MLLNTPSSVVENIISAEISYYNLRLVKSSLKLEYKSVTHEYLDIGKSIDYINKLDSIKINDIDLIKTISNVDNFNKFFLYKGFINSSIL